MYHRWYVSYGQNYKIEFIKQHKSSDSGKLCLSFGLCAQRKRFSISVFIEEKKLIYILKENVGFTAKLLRWIRLDVDLMVGTRLK